LYDLLVPNHGSHPWQLTLHFTGFPSSTLTEYTGEASLQNCLFHSLKEASFIARNTANPVMAMTVEAKNDLWKALGGSNGSGSNGRGGAINYSKYREIMHSIPLISPESLDAVPIRVYLRPGSSSGGGRGSSYLSSYESISQTSRPAPISNPDGRPKTIGAALTPIIITWLKEHNAWKKEPTLDTAQKESGNHSGEESTMKIREAASAAEAEEDKEIEAAWSQVDVALSGGIELHPNLILKNVHRDLHSPDFFLYIMLQMRQGHR
jgi:autophagy-related protein 5